ncbi:MAG: FHA domain-containing protein [Planctomycetes bacterium]|nr:FHA domain-containing protein [Planctomycetota bacterium]MBI3845105.1 FHA domain-containing protein [Planctomycetota bacterium]
MAKLIISDKGREVLYEIIEDTVVIGASRECNLQVRDPKAAHIHCQIRRSSRGWKLVDLETKAGTIVNGKVVNQHDLANGDKIQIGDVVMRFEFEGGRSSPVAAAAPSRRMTPAARPTARARATAGPADVDEEEAPAYVRVDKSGTPPIVITLIIAGVLLASLLGWLIFSKEAIPKDRLMLQDAQRAYAEGRLADAEFKLNELDRFKGLTDDVRLEANAMRKKFDKHGEEAAKNLGFKMATKENEEAVTQGNAIVETYYHLPLKPKREKIEELRRRITEYSEKFKDLSPDNVARVQKVLPLLDKKLAEIAKSSEDDE